MTASCHRLKNGLKRLQPLPLASASSASSRRGQHLRASLDSGGLWISTFPCSPATDDLVELCRVKPYDELAEGITGSMSQGFDVRLEGVSQCQCLRREQHLGIGSLQQGNILRARVPSRSGHSSCKV
jgi:hypothetical protein